jgi:hypothetical protein
VGGLLGKLTKMVVAIQPESGLNGAAAGMGDGPLAVTRLRSGICGRGRCGPSRYYGGAAAGGSQGPPEVRCWTLTGGRRVRPGWR